MKLHYFLLVLIFILLSVPLASAESDRYNFDVTGGSNTLNLNTSYNGSFVNSISGSFYTTEGLPQNRIPITINSDFALENATIKLEIPYKSLMASDFSDIRFTHENGTNIQYYIHNYTSKSSATVYLKMDVSKSNLIYLDFNILNATSESNSTNMFKYQKNNYSIAGSSDNLTHYSGNYNTLEMGFSAYVTGGTSIMYRLTLSDYPRLARTNAWFTWANNSSSNISMISTSNGSYTSCYVYVGQNKTVTSTLSNSTASKSESFTHSSSYFTRLYAYSTAVNRSQNFTYIYLYNSTGNVSYNFGTIENIPQPGIEQITIDVPQGIFNTLNYTSATSGKLEFNVNYSPHVVMISENESSFGYMNAFLEFDAHPSNLSVQYEIALDQNFYSIVESGFSNGEISSNLSNNSYYWRIKQPDGSWSETRSFTVEPPPLIPGSLSFKIVNELNNTNVSATVKLTNSTTTLQKTGANITFNGSEVGAGNYSVQVNATNYTTRYYEVVSPGKYTLYILPITANYSVVYFSLIDNTNTFQYKTTKLEIIKQTPNGSIVVQNPYFDVSGLAVTTLNQFDNYILKIVSDSGQERILGNYIQAGQTTVQLVVSEIILKDTNSSQHGGFSYNLTKTENLIKLNWVNPDNSLTEPMIFQIYKNNELMFNISTDAPFGSINYYDSVDGETKLDPDATYRIVFVAKTVDGTIRVNEYYRVNGESVGIDFDKIPTALRIVISFILLILIASLFNITNAKFSAIVVSLVAAFLAGIQFLPIIWAVIIWVLFIAVVAYKTNR